MNKNIITSIATIATLFLLTASVHAEALSGTLVAGARAAAAAIKAPAITAPPPLDCDANYVYGYQTCCWIVGGSFSDNDDGTLGCAYDMSADNDKIWDDCSDVNTLRKQLCDNEVRKILGLAQQPLQLN